MAFRGMTGYEQPDDSYQPLFWVQGRPVYATMLLILAHVASLIGGVILTVVINRSDAIEPFMFTDDRVLHHYAFWQIFTYAFAHPLSWNFIYSMFLLYWCGFELERFLGRRVFLILYGVLLVVTPLFLLLSRLIVPDVPTVGGAFYLHFGIFIAYATLYPNVQFIWGIANVIIAWILIVFFSLVYFAGIRSDPSALPLLWANIVVGYLGVRYAGGAGGLPLVEEWMAKWRQRRKPAAAARSASSRALPARSQEMRGSSAPVRRTAGGEELHDEIDPLLEKIRQSGLSSLTPGERATLERARTILLRKERGN